MALKVVSSLPEMWQALTDALRRVLATPETAAAMGQRGLAKIQGVEL